MHGKEFEEVSKEKEPWFTNLEKAGGDAREEAAQEDELQALRRRAEAHPEGKAKGEEESPKRKKKKKEKSKKEQKVKGAEVERARKRYQPSSDVEEGGPGQKEPGALFSGTALDPSPKVRAKVLKKARRLGRKKKKKKKQGSSSSSGSSGSSSSSSSTSLDAAGSLFSTEKRMNIIYRKYPGALAASAMAEAREHLMTTSGTLWDVSRRELPPIATQYTRQHLAQTMSPPMRCFGPEVEILRDHLQGDALVDWAAA